jgi:pimeloyl-ACP methyl ester carboxylesterase
VDLPGFGASPEPPAPWGSREYAELLAPLLADGGWTLLGHSFGGRVAVQLAAGWPESVDRVVLTGVPLLRRTASGKAPAAFRAAKWLHAKGLLSDERMEAERRKRGSADYRAAQGVMRDTLVRLVNEDYRELLPQVKAPVSLVWGAHDTAAPLATAQEAAAILPSATLAVSESSGHLLDDALVALLREALR